jgi:transcriptional regulator with XRE-family HTH domain
MSDFKYRLKEARSAKGWTQAGLAKKTNLTPAAISQFESGDREPNLDSLKKLSDELGVPLDFFAGKETKELGDDLVLFRNLKGLTEEDQKILMGVYHRLKTKDKKDA